MVSPVGVGQAYYEFCTAMLGNATHNALAIRLPHSRQNLSSISAVNEDYQGTCCADSAVAGILQRGPISW